jgi:hypothetical protein
MKHLESVPASKLRGCADTHLRLAGEYERGGNADGARQLRAMANLLYALLDPADGNWSTVLPGVGESPPSTEERLAEWGVPPPPDERLAGLGLTWPRDRDFQTCGPAGFPMEIEILMAGEIIPHLVGKIKIDVHPYWDYIENLGGEG